MTDVLKASLVEDILAEQLISESLLKILPKFSFFQGCS